MNPSFQFCTTCIWLTLAALSSASSISATESSWPSETQIEHDNKRLNLLVFIHPRCRCSENIDEHVLAVKEAASGSTTTTFIFFCAEDKPDTWAQNSTWDRLNADGEHKLLIDRGGVEAKRFNVSASGHCMLFDTNQHLLFSGGLGADKEGNPSSQAIATLTTQLSESESDVSAFPVVGCSLEERPAFSNYDFFTNYGNYMPRIHCLQTAQGSPDWPWIITLVILNMVVLAGYVKIIRTWRRCYFNEEEQDRDPKLMDLAWIFFFCGISGYGVSTMIFFWPAYRLLAVFLLLLAFVTWRFVFNIKDFEESFATKRVGRIKREKLEVEIADSVVRESVTREAQKELQAILDSLPSHVCILNAQGLIVQANAKWKRFALQNGGSGSCLNASYLDACRSATGECRDAALELAEAIEQMMRDGSGTYSAEYACHSEHEKRWFEVCVMPADYLKATIIVTHTDITQRVLAEKEAQIQREEAERLALVAKYTDNAVVITDQKVRVEWVNDGFTRLTGFTLDEVSGKNPGHVLQGEGTDPATVDFMRERISRKQGFDVEIINYSKSGKEFWLAIEMRPIEDADGNIVKFIAIERDITERKRHEKELATLNHELSETNEVMAHRAFHDSLTGLPNRASILQTIQQVIDNSKCRRFALLFLDFDHFKLINDSLGHKAGDELLRQISDRLRHSVRDHDTVVPARLGGDEFVVLLNDLPDWDSACHVAQRLLEAFSTSFELLGSTVHSTASIGIATNQHDYRSAIEMLRDADLAMYEAKTQGRGCYAVFDRSMHERVDTRLKIECDLRNAILNDEFELHYQPIVSIESGRLESVESLVRWRHPEQGLVSPGDFIPVAEETRLILPIGEYVLDEACRQFAFWQTTLGDHAPRGIHVNVSRLQMLLPKFVDLVADRLRKYKVPPHCLHIEVTESVMMEDTCTIVSVMSALKKLGVMIDMDDFGTGYSSLSCVHSFPIDVLKIDRLFISSARDVQENVALLHAILGIASSLSLQVVAEGVETPEQLATLQAMGCEYGQGYLFSKPLSADGLEAYARRPNLSGKAEGCDGTPSLNLGFPVVPCPGERMI